MQKAWADLFYFIDVLLSAVPRLLCWLFPLVVTVVNRQAGKALSLYKQLYMKFLSLQPFVPSGTKFNESKAFFTELGFNLAWDMGDYAGFENNGFRFILQKYDDKAFAENFMLSVGVENADAFRAYVVEKELPQKYGIRIGEVADQPYGREVNIIDLAGVCWHFVQQ